MNYFFDTEFNGHGGAMISAGLVREDGESIYLVVPPERIEEIKASGMDPWVEKNILPILYDLPEHVTSTILPENQWGYTFSSFIYNGDSHPHIVADWPSDIMDFCRLLMTGPGVAVSMRHLTSFTIIRHIDVYPTTLPGAVQHNAWWDAMALRHYWRGDL